MERKILMATMTMRLLLWRRRLQKAVGEDPVVGSDSEGDSKNVDASDVV